MKDTTLAAVFPTLLLLLGVAAAIAGLHRGQSLAGPAFEPSLLFLISGLLIASLDLVGLGVVTMVVRVLPRWVGALIILGSPPCLLFVPSAFENLLAYEALHPLLSGVAWTLVGYALFRVPVRADPQ